MYFSFMSVLFSQSILCLKPVPCFALLPPQNLVMWGLCMAVLQCWWMFTVCLSAATAMCLSSGAVAINQRLLSFFISVKSSRRTQGLCVLSRDAPPYTDDEWLMMSEVRFPPKFNWWTLPPVSNKQPWSSLKTDSRPSPLLLWVIFIKIH